MKRDRNEPIASRNVYSLRSLIVVTKLLAECAEVNWDYNEVAPIRKGRIPVAYGEIGFVKPSLKYHTVLPPKIRNDVAKSLIQQLIDLRSDSSIFEAISLLSNGNVQAQSNIGLHPFKSLIDEIDEYCAMVCRYLSASNWSVVSQIVKSKMDFMKSCIAEENEIIPHIDILSIIYLDQGALGMIFQDLWQFLSTVRKPLHQSLLLYFFSLSLQYWIFARPEEIYEAGKEGSPIQLEASSLFDYVYTTIENSKFTDGATRFLTVLLCYFPSSFKTFLNSSIKRFTANSKKLKFLSFLNSNIHLKHMPDGPLDCLSIIASVAQAVMDFDRQSPILQYACQFHDQISSNFHSSFGSEISVSLIHIYCDYFNAFSLIDIQYPFKDLDANLTRQDLEPTIICYITTALRGLGTVETKLEAYQTLMKKYSPILRNIIFKQSRLLLKSRAVGSSSRKSLSTTNSEVVSIPILSNIFQCYIPSPLSYFSGYKEGDFAALVVSGMEPILPCLIDHDNDLSKAATNWVLAFLDKKLLNSLDPHVDSNGDHPAVAIYLCTTHILNALSEKILEIDLDDNRLERFLRLMKDLLEARASIGKTFHLAEACGDVIKDGESDGLRNIMFSNVEAALLISLCSPDVEIYKLIAAAITAALDDSLELGDLSDNILSSPFLYNRDQYKEFNPNSYVITGHVALQKRIRKVVSQFTVATDGIMNAWEIIDKRVIDYFNNSQTSSTFIPEARNYAGMLASLCECILATDPETNIRVSELTPAINEYIQEITKLMESPSLIICNATKDILCREFSRYAIHNIFIGLGDLIRRVIGSKRKDNILKVSDLFISLIKGVITRCIEEKLSLELIVAERLQDIMNYIDDMGNDIEVLKMKIRCAKLAGDLKDNEYLFESKFSTKVYYQSSLVLFKWFEQAALSNENVSSLNILTTTDRKRTELEHVYKDLALESIKATALMMKGTSIFVPGSNSEEDILQSKSVVCANFFSVGVRTLEKYTGVSSSNFNGSSSMIEKTMNSSSASSLPSSEHSNNKPISQRDSAICNYIVELLSNILKMNSDVGMRFAFPLGYHNSPQVRSAFVNVLANVLVEGTGGQLDSTLDDKYQSLMKYLRSNLSIAVLICDSCPAGEIDGLATALLNLYMSAGLGLTLIKAAVAKEIQRTTKVVELLRRNSVATRMLGIYAKKYGSNYLSSTLTPVLQSFLDDPSGHVFELSADKLEENKRAENVDKFMKSLSSFSIAFIKSLDSMPSEFKEICCTIRSVAVPSFPEAAATSVGSFLFLRFFCPAIVAPESNDLLKGHLRRDVRRSLLLVAKVIQNMANGSLYSLKLPLLYERMGELNKINDQINRFLTEAAIPSDNEIIRDSGFDISELINTGDNEENGSKSIEIEKEDMWFIHGFLYDHLDILNKNAATLQEDNVPNTAFKGSDIESLPSISASFTSNPDSLAMARLDELVEAIGQPKQRNGTYVPEQIVTDTSKQGLLLYDFMTKNAAKDFGAMLEKQLVKEGVSEDGLPFIIISLGMFDSHTVTDPDMVTYRIFQLLSNLWNDKFSVFLDCTGFNERNTVEKRVFEKFVELIPVSASKNCVGIYYINCSSVFFSNISIILNIFGKSIAFNPSFTPHHFICTFNEELPIKPLGMAKKTRSVLSDARTQYEVYKFDKLHNNFIPIDIKVGEEYVHVCKAEPVSIECGGRVVYFKLYDLYHATDFKDVKQSNKIEDDAFIFNLDGRPSITLSSPQRNDIIRDVNAMVARFSEHSSSSSSNDITVSSIRDVISMMTNIATFGVTADDNNTRVAAFKILSSLSAGYGLKYDMTSAREGIYFPKNNIEFLISFFKSTTEQLSEWAYPFSKSFIFGFERVQSTKKDTALQILSLWMPYIYSKVYTQDEKKGPRRTKYLIREWIKLTQQNPKLYSTFRLKIWKPLFQEPGLTTALVETIIFAAIDKQASGEDSEDIISLLLVKKSDDICKTVIDQAINLTGIPIEVSNESEEFVYSSVSWNETLVLVKALNALLFGARDLCEKFLPEICFIISSYINRGPYELKFFVQKLAVNVFSSFSTVDYLSVESKNNLNLILEGFTSSRGDLLFGVNSGNNNVNAVHTAQLLGTITEIVSDMQKILGIVGEKKKFEWKAKWASYTIDAAFKKNSIVRARAISILGDLIEEKDTERVIGSILKLLVITTKLAALNDNRALDLNICIVHCASKVVGKLPPSSPLIRYLFWIGCACSQFPLVDYFMIGTNLFVACLERMEIMNFYDGDLVGTLTRTRKEVGGSSLPKCEELVNVRYTPEMFDSYMTALVLRGLYIPTTRHHTLSVLQTLMRVRFTSDKIYLEKNGPKSISPIGKLSPTVYVCFLYLFSRSYREFRKFLACIENSIKFVDFGGDIFIPMIMLEFFGTSSEQSFIALWFCGIVARDPKVDEHIFFKAIRWTLMPSDTDKGKYLRFMSTMCQESRIKLTFEHSSNQDVIESCQELISSVMGDPKFDYEKRSQYLADFDRVPKKYGLYDPSFRDLAGSDCDAFTMVSCFQDILERSSALVEGN